MTTSFHRGAVGAVALIAAALAVAAWFVFSGDSSSSTAGSDAKSRSPHRFATLRMGGAANGSEGSASSADVATGLTGMTMMCSSPTGNAATVDGEPITLDRLCGWLTRLGAVTPAGTSREQARLVLDQMIDAMLVRRALVASGESVSDADVNAAMKRLGAGSSEAELLAQQVRDRLELRALIARKGGGTVTDEDIEREVAAGAPGLDRGHGMKVDAWVARIAQNEQPAAQATAEQTAKAFAQKVATEKPEVAAKQHGMTRVPAFVVTASGVEPELEDTALALAKGQWSPPIRTKVGWIVVRAIEPIEGKKLDDNQLRERVRAALESRLLKSAREQLLARLRAAARIEVLVDL